MSEIYNIYCDESCHLENDSIHPMALGAVWLPKDKTKEVNKRIREIKSKHGLSKAEAKWTKISSNCYEMYMDLIDYFFDDDDLHFRGLVIPDKQLLQHEYFAQDHDQWYYKMFFNLLKIVLSPKNKYRLYLDYKDTNGNIRLKKLHEVLCNNFYDFDRNIIETYQLVKSHQIEIIQLTDILIGALTYYYRNLTTNSGKLAIIDRIKERSRYSLDNNTLYREEKFNLLIWKPQKGRSE